MKIVLYLLVLSITFSLLWTKFSYRLFKEENDEGDYYRMMTLRYSVVAFVFAFILTYIKLTV